MKKNLFSVLFLIIALFAFSEEALSEGGASLLNANFMTGVSDRYAAQEGERYDIKLLTAAPGSKLFELYFWWGHSAIIVEDYQAEKQTIYDYGVFSVPEKNLLISFLKGRIDYLVVDTDFYSQNQVVSPFLYQNRWVVIQHLNLEPAARYRLATYLKNNAQGGNNKYKYHFYNENCCTKLRDLIDYAVNGQFYEKLNTPGEATLRTWCRAYLQKSFMADWALQFLLGPSVDLPTTEWDRLFLPYELMSEVQGFSYIDSNGETRQLVDYKEEHLPPSIGVQWEKAGIARDKGIFMGDPLRIKKGPSWTWLLGLCVGLAVGAIGAICYLIGTRKKAARIVAGIWTSVISLLLFALSVVLTIMQFFSTMDVTFGNWNIILINPITMFIAFLLSVLYAANIGKSGIAYSIFWMIMAVVAIVLSILTGVGVCPQDNLMIMSALLPFFILMAISGLFKNLKKGGQRRLKNENIEDEEF